LGGTGIAMVFQEPMTALRPLKTVGDQISEMFRTHTDLGRREIEARLLRPPRCARHRAELAGNLF
jgi:peptide/nickel transport system ATP-binding protein